MTYTLELHFKPSVERRKLLQFLASRRNYKIDRDDKNEIVYDNADTSMRFFLTLRPAFRLSLRRKIGSAELTLNYFRPSYFGLEAEIELSALMAAFQPRLEDAQIHGMGEGPYSGEAFLRGWGFGNLFSIRSTLEAKSDLNVPTLPADKVRAAWIWNYRHAEASARLRTRRHVSEIKFAVIRGQVSTVALWPRGVPVSLPKVDYVAVIRDDSGEEGFGFAPWSEVVELARRAEARFDVTKEPLDLEYFVTPPAIEKWVTEMPLVPLETIERLAPHWVIDTEIVEAARKAERDGETLYLSAAWQDLRSRMPLETVHR